MRSTTSDIKDFALAVWSDWWTLLSGPASVPTAALALWVSNETAKVLLGLTAFVFLWFSAYRLWKREHDKVVERDERKRQLLDDIAVLREKVGDYRIAMEADHRGGLFDEKAWLQKYNVLETEIASKIERLLSKAEARTYLYRGNLQRAARPGRPGTFMWPVLIDVSIRDLNWLETFVHDLSRG
jgi:hypothetical protein